MLIIKNGKIVTEHMILESRDLLIRDELIVAIVSAGSVEAGENDEIIDARGGYVSPGLIDVHSDYIEHMSAPRPSSMMDFSLSLHEFERELIGHGITTMFHSLSIYRKALFSEKPIRNAENVQKFADLIEESHSRRHLVRHRFHARYELDNLERTDELMEYITGKKVHLVSFMDHTPGQGQYRDLEMYRKTLKGYQTLSEAELDDIIKDSQSAKKLTFETIQKIAKVALENGIAVASHDDDTTDKISLIKGLGATISEFPITMEVAREARAQGLHTIAGAPNILLGGSHAGNLSASEAVRDGCIDILCSDYYPAAMLHAVFILHEKYGLGLADMFSLVTINPARAVHMDGITGSIEAGKRADVLIVEKIDNGFPVVTTAIVDGKRVFTTSYR